MLLIADSLLHVTGCSSPTPVGARGACPVGRPWRGTGPGGDITAHRAGPWLSRTVDGMSLARGPPATCAMGARRRHWWTSSPVWSRGPGRASTCCTAAPPTPPMRRGHQRWFPWNRVWHRVPQVCRRIPWIQSIIITITDGLASSPSTSVAGCAGTTELQAQQIPPHRAEAAFRTEIHR